MASSPLACSPEEAGMSGQPSNYSLRWNNHQAHILRAFEDLLHNELLVDVTLVCAETAIKAHKVVLSACSPFFERIFAEHPCKHPTIVLKDFSAREMNHLVDFMYRGEVRVESEDLAALMDAAASLQVRGLIQSEPRPATPPATPATDNALLDELQPADCSTPEPRDRRRESSASLADNMTIDDEDEHCPPDSPTIPLPLTTRDQQQQSVEQRLSHPAHHHQQHGSYGQRELLDSSSSSLLPRRKQARPRRRSGELVPQDLSRPHPTPSISPPSTGLNLSNHSLGSHAQQQSPQRSPSHRQQETQRHEQRQRSPSSRHHSSQQHQHQSQQSEEQEEEAENLSMKKEPRHSRSPSRSAEPPVKSESEEANSTRSSPPLITPGNLHPDAPFADLPVAGLTAMSGLSMTPPQHHANEYLTNLGQLAAQWLPGASQQNHLSAGGAASGPGNPAGPGPGAGSIGGNGGSQPRHPRDSSPQGKGPAYPYQQSESPLTPRSAFAMEGLQPLGATAGLFHHGPGFDLHDSFKPETLQSFYVGANLGHHHQHHHSGKKSKKHRGDSSARRWSDHVRGLGPMCRPKGQHSAPRGGPPRSWTNTDLTDALTMVWNKRMTTSQASRVFGIPYNSLLMYVRGKYGKSLKLEQLRRDCVAGEVMNSINNNVKPAGVDSPSPRLPGLGAPPGGGPPGHPPSSGQQPGSGLSESDGVGYGPPGHPLLGAGFFPELAGFPLPVNMVHLLPPSEQNSYEGPQTPGAGSNNGATSGSNGHLPSTATGRDERSRSSSPLELSVDGMPEGPTAPAGLPTLLQQNGSAAVE